ncbi:MAG TPA: FAD-dependent oxidoreductase [Solirubrobacteraceae bacterium]|nr:FAD-dependent oxidoreductase [Solirubrobacteraceae bacterium]
MCARRESATVVIAGGGFAAVEAMLALRALAASRVRLELVCPDSVLRDHPVATVDPLGDDRQQDHDLAAIAADLGAQHHLARLEAVAPHQHRVRLGSGAVISYDALILAIGARQVPSLAGALTFRDRRDVALVRRLVAEIKSGIVRRVAFAVPGGCSWPLPLYELALHVAGWAAASGQAPELSLVTPEPRPLALFGEQAARLVAGLLEDRGVRFVGCAVPTRVWPDGTLALVDGTLDADRVLTLPELRGRRLPGVPADWWGFVPTDDHGRVDGLRCVYAAGDVTAHPIKQGGLACQQADRVAAVIAARLGAPVRESRGGYVLRATLMGGERPVLLRAELDWRGSPTKAALERPLGAQAAGVAKVFGRYLTPYLEARAPSPAGGRSAA